MEFSVAVQVFVGGMLCVLLEGSLFIKADASGCTNIDHRHVLTSVTIDNEETATVEIHLLVISDCPSYLHPQYTIHLQGLTPADHRESSCELSIENDTPSFTHYKLEGTCSVPTNGVYNMTLIAQLGAGKNLTYLGIPAFYTTDIQNVSATTGTSEAEVSCYFAEGTDCKGCFVQVGWTTDSGIEPVHELTVYRYNSLNATGTIRQLMPGRSYHVIAYDIERSGLRSSVGVPLLGGISTMSDGEPGGGRDSDDKDFKAAFATTFTVLILLAGCVGLAVFLIYRRSKVQVSVRRGIQRRRKRRQNDGKEKSKKGEDVTPPPIPPHTPDMHHLTSMEDSFFSGSTHSRAMSTLLSPDSGVFTISDGSSTGNASSITVAVECHISSSATEFDAVSSDSIAPPLPMRLAESCDSIPPPIPPRLPESLELIDTPKPTTSHSDTPPPPIPPKPTVSLDDLAPAIPPKPAWCSNAAIGAPLVPPRPTASPRPLSAKPEPEGSGNGEDDVEDDIGDRDFVTLPDILLPPRNVPRQSWTCQWQSGGDSIVTEANPAYRSHPCRTRL